MICCWWRSKTQCILLFRHTHMSNTCMALGICFQGPSPSINQAERPYAACARVPHPAWWHGIFSNPDLVVPPAAAFHPSKISTRFAGRCGPQIVWSSQFLLLGWYPSPQRHASPVSLSLLVEARAKAGCAGNNPTKYDQMTKLHDQWTPPLPLCSLGMLQEAHRCI